MPRSFVVACLLSSTVLLLPIVATAVSPAVHDPAWSPDGTHISFASDRDGDFETFTAEPDGSDPRQVTDKRCRDLAHNWSPDGQRLAFETPSWSGDERRVVFYAVRGRASALYEVGADGSGRRNLAIEKGSEVSDEGAPSPALRTLRDVAYVPDPHPEQRLDFYWPPGAPATVLFVHGGSLKESGERRSSPEYQDICPTFAAAGVGCATVDYRLFPSFSWPAMAEDVAAAVAKVRGLVEEQGGDPGRLVLFGHSSGCQLAAVLGANPVYLAGVGLEPGNLAGVVAMGCVLDNYDAALRDLTAERIAAAFAEDPDERARWGSAEGWIAANPSYHLGAHMPPTLVLVAEGERFFPPLLEQGARFVRRLLELDVPADLVVVPGTHRTSIEGVGDAGDSVFEVVRSFVLDPSGVGSE